MAQALTRFFALPRSAQDAMATSSWVLGRNRFAWAPIARKHVALYRHVAEQEERP
jgi:hypothetical protein